MGVASFCLVTVTLVSTEILGVVTPVGVDLLVAVPFPEINGNVEINLLGLLGVDVTLTVPCPSVDFEAQVGLGGLLVANLEIQVTPA